MSGLTRKGRRLVPLVGDMLFSVLTIPLSFTALEKWTSEPEIKNDVRGDGRGASVPCLPSA